MAEKFDAIAQLIEHDDNTRAKKEEDKLITNSIRRETWDLKMEVEQWKMEKARLIERIRLYSKSFKEYGFDLKLIPQIGRNGNDYTLEFKKWESMYQLSLPGWQTNQFSMKLEDILDTILVGLKNQGNIEIKDHKKGGSFLEEWQLVGKEFTIGWQVIEKISWRLNPRNNDYQGDKERWAVQWGYIDYLKTIKTSIETLRTL